MYPCQNTPHSSHTHTISRSRIHRTCPCARMEQQQLQPGCLDYRDKLSPSPASLAHCCSLTFLRRDAFSFSHMDMMELSPCNALPLPIPYVYCCPRMQRYTSYISAIRLKGCFTPTHAQKGCFTPTHAQCAACHVPSHGYRYHLHHYSDQNKPPTRQWKDVRMCFCSCLAAFH